MIVTWSGVASKMDIRDYKNTMLHNVIFFYLLDFAITQGMLLPEK